MTVLSYVLEQHEKSVPIDSSDWAKALLFLHNPRTIEEVASFICQAVDVLTDQPTLLAQTVRFVNNVYSRPTAKKLNLGRDVVGTGGTGGLGRQRLNVTTLASILAASTGTRVLKWGNHGTHHKGSLDLIAELGVDPKWLTVNKANRTIDKCGLAILPVHSLYYPIFGNVVRKARYLHNRPTIFNLLGPLLNPAELLMIGAYTIPVAQAISQAMLELGKFGIVVHATQGKQNLDELCFGGMNYVWDVTEKIEQIEWLEHTPTAKRINPNPAAGIKYLQGKIFGQVASTIELNARLITECYDGGIVAANKRLDSSAAQKMWQTYKTCLKE